MFRIEQQIAPSVDHEMTIQVLSGMGIDVYAIISVRRRR
jgi:hypothetical protein